MNGKLFAKSVYASSYFQLVSVQISMKYEVSFGKFVTKVNIFIGCLLVDSKGGEY